MTKFAMVTTAVCALVWAAPARAAETKVELKNVHMCCDGCAKEVTKILGKVEGVTGVACDQKARTARFTAANAKDAAVAFLPENMSALQVHNFEGIVDVRIP